MKKVILAACFAAAAAGAAAAGSPIDSAAIYQALDVPEMKTTDVDSVTYKKSVGGLECGRNIHNAGIVHHYCSLAFDQANAEAIYNALNVPEQPPDRPSPGITVDIKSVDGLTCTKRHVVRSGGHMDITTYGCELKVP
jgi:hypothetical protein